MNSASAMRSVQATKTSESGMGAGAERRRIDVTGLPADQVAEYLQAGGDSNRVYFERRAGKTYAVAMNRETNGQISNR